MIAVLALLTALIAAPATADDVGGITPPTTSTSTSRWQTAGRLHQVRRRGPQRSPYRDGPIRAIRTGDGDQRPVGNLLLLRHGRSGFLRRPRPYGGGAGAEVPDSFEFHVRANGYQRTPIPELNQSWTIRRSHITKVSSAGSSPGKISSTHRRPKNPAARQTTRSIMVGT